MESMHKLVELERINFAMIPTIELGTKLTEGLAQVAIMRDSRPFSNQAFDPFRDFLHSRIAPSGYASALSRASRAGASLRFRLAPGAARRLQRLLD